jgi:hypothetical protein
MLPSARFSDHRVSHVELCHPHVRLCHLQRIISEAVWMPLLGEGPEPGLHFVLCRRRREPQHVEREIELVDGRLRRRWTRWRRGRLMRCLACWVLSSFGHGCFECIDDARGSLEARSVECLIEQEGALPVQSSDPGDDPDTPILAIDQGVVTHVHSQNIGDAGIWTAVRHPSGISSRYIHLSRVLVAVGQLVQRGERIALSGDTASPGAYFTERDHRNQSIAITETGRWRSLGAWRG